MNDFSVIGLLGPAGSGKDLVADWFVSKGFVKVAFADPMKRFVAKAFSISPERLWGPSELRNELFEVNEAWWYEVIGHFGDAAQEIVQGVLEHDIRITGYLKLHDWLSNLRQTYPKEISARFILQTLGTEWGRAVDPLMWAKYTHKIIDKLSRGGLVRYRQVRYGLYVLDDGPDKRAAGVIIPDHRFRNEVELTHKMGGHVIRLNRLAKNKDLTVGIVGHQSEAEHKELPDNLFHAVYDLPEGVDRVHALLETTFEDRPWEWATTKPELVTDGYVTVAERHPAESPAVV